MFFSQFWLILPSYHDGKIDVAFVYDCSGWSELAWLPWLAFSFYFYVGGMLSQINVKPWLSHHFWLSISAEGISGSVAEFLQEAWV